MKKEKFLGLIISVSIFIVSLCLVELSLWFFTPVPDPYEKYYAHVNQYIKWDRKPHERMITELEAELPGADGENIFTTNNMGFRGDELITPKPENEFRIFLIGSSNAECFYLDDSDSLDAVLQVELNKHLPPDTSVKVYNAAQSAYQSSDMISMIVHRIVQLEPDMLVVFSSDLYAPLRNHDYLHRIEESPKKKFPLVRFLATEFQIPRRVYYTFKKIAPTEQEIYETVSLKSKYLTVINKLKNTPISDAEPQTNIPAFKNNLRTIIGIAQAHKFQMVFMTPQTTWNSKVDPEAKKWHWALYYNGVRYREDLMYEALDSYNNTIRQLAANYNVPVYDLARIIPKSSEYFYDDGHFNVKGAAFTGSGLASFILQEGLIR